MGTYNHTKRRKEKEPKKKTKQNQTKKNENIFENFWKIVNYFFEFYNQEGKGGAGETPSSFLSNFKIVFRYISYTLLFMCP